MNSVKNYAIHIWICLLLFLSACSEFGSEFCRGLYELALFAEDIANRVARKNVCILVIQRSGVAQCVCICCRVGEGALPGYVLHWYCPIIVPPCCR